MSEREHIVSVNRGVDLVAFNQEMIATTGAGSIPSRTVGVADPRATNIRSTHYMLTDAEAKTLKADPRVFGVNLLPDLDDGVGIGFSAIQSGDFTKTTLDRGDFLNWGMRRMNEATNPYTGVNAAAGGYNYTLDGTGVDVVIVDSGIQADHPEFQDAAGVSRVQQINWFTASGVSGTMPTAHYTDYHGHGTHVAGTAAGKTYGWAKNAKIFSIKLNGLQGSSDPYGGISTTAMADVIIGWHNAKGVDATTGVKRPTIVNHSWGYAKPYNAINSLTYRGSEKTSFDIDSSAERHAFGLTPASGASFGTTYATNLRISAVDADVQLMIDAGIHVCIAAGNRQHKIDTISGLDYNNFITIGGQDTYYNRGSSPFDDDAHMVGSVDSSTHSGGLEQKATYSETGPGVSIYAPGTYIMSAMSTTNAFGANTTNNPYPGNAAFLINNISGTSMASPQVAGLLSLWIQLNPVATPAQALAYFGASAKTAQLYDTASVVDYTDTRSLLGSTNRFAFNKFNSNVQLRIGALAAAPAATPAATYALATSSAAVNEGSTFTITLTTTNIEDATVIPYTITGVTTADLSSASLTGNFTIANNSATVSFTVAADATTEGGETFVLSLDTLGTTQSVTINDTSTTPVLTYAVAPASGSVNEGSALVFNVTTANVADATTLYWTVTSAADFSTTTGSFAISSDAGSFSVTPTADTTTEGAETFTASVRTVSASGSVVATSSTVTINDTSVTPGDPTYGVVPTANNVNEGSALTFNVTTTNVADATTLYWTATSAADFSTSSGSFTITSNAGSVAVTPTADTTTEGAETFTLQIRTASVGGSVVATSSAVTINDTSVTPGPTYDATPASASVNEGSALTINVATTNVADATTLYWTATNSGDFSTASGSFAITSDTGSFTVTPTADTTTEGAETFQIQIRTDSISGTIVDTSDAITINDTSLTPTADYTINVGNNGSSDYTLSGTDRNGSVSGNDPAISFNNGDVVDFVVSASGHPFWIKTAQVTGTGSGATGVTNNGTQSGTVQWTVGSTGTFYYICQFHAGMVGTITAS